MTPTKEQIREQYLANQLFLIGEKLGPDLEVIDRRANYIVVVNGLGETYKMFLDEAYELRMDASEFAKNISGQPKHPSGIPSQYTDPAGLTHSELEDHLHKVWHSHYADYSKRVHGYDGPDYHEMVAKFAADPFYNMHYVAKEYLKSPAEYRKAPYELKEGRLRFSSFVTKAEPVAFAYKGYKPLNFQDPPDAQAVFESLTKAPADPYAVLSAIKHVDIFFEKRDEHSLDIARKAVAKIDKIENHPYLNESKENFLKDSAVKHVVYHGSAFNIHKFWTKPGETIEGAAFFTEDPKVAHHFAKEAHFNNEEDAQSMDTTHVTGPVIYPVHLHIKNPLVLDADAVMHTDENGKYFHSLEKMSDAIDHARSHGYDGLHIKNVPEFTERGLKPADQWAAFHPHQIKSATGNNGNFSLKSPKITEDTIKDEEIDFQIEEKLTYSALTSFLTESFEHHVHQVLDHLEKNPAELDKLADHVKTIEHIAHHYDHHTVHMSESIVNQMHYPSADDLHDVVHHIFKSASYYGGKYGVRADELRDHMNKAVGRWGQSGEKTRKAIDSALVHFGKGTSVKPDDVIGKAREFMSEETEHKAIENAEGAHRIVIRKLSSGPQLVKIAKRAAVELIAQKLANKPVKKISEKEKNEIVKAIKQKKTVVMKLARKLVPKIRHIEHEHQEHGEEFGSGEG